MMEFLSVMFTIAMYLAIGWALALLAHLVYLRLTHEYLSEGVRLCIIYLYPVYVPGMLMYFASVWVSRTVSGWVEASFDWIEKKERLRWDRKMGDR